MFTKIISPWDELFFDCVKQSNQVIRIASPFIKEGVTSRLIEKKSHKVSIKYLNSFKSQHFYSGVSDLSALTAILNNKGTVRNLPRLHSKIYIFDDSKAIITSGNLTWNGLKHNHEYGVFVTEPTFVQDVIKDFEDVYNDLSTGVITAAKIEEVSKILEATPREITVKFSKIEIDTNEISDSFVGGIDPILQALTGWKLSILQCLEQIPFQDFTLADMYTFESSLQKKYPANNNIQEKIRQQLQYLRDLGIIEFLGGGSYRKLW